MFTPQPMAAGAHDIGAQVLKAQMRAVAIVGDHRAADKAFFGDLGPAHVGGPDRLHFRAVNTGQQEHCVVDRFEQLLEVAAEDTTFGGFDDDAHRIAESCQIVLVIPFVCR
ncbi:hypothetical protein [Marinobacterium rhizophilum]|uniref:Uncharacterized protein n=1 Tax=Marinobacterium rhizophilum TaxID=420402 RepID=A0ABY5HK27_9GAMM|nr:hypothetical protein [Marinobacterium rhizophilum]UTW12735.1 hypothetical protein KDW95_03380 [Marinobacterium rhizophilum]